MTNHEKSHDISGVYTALITPFKMGSIDYEALGNLCARQVVAGVDGLVLSGTTGESPTLNTKEKLELVTFVRREFGSQIRIMGGSGNNNTADSAKLSQGMAEAGADSLLVVTPPYNKPSQAGLVAHFKAVSTATPLPICLYHVPGRTGQRLSPRSLADLCSIDQVVAVKEASADLALFSEANQLSDASYLSGDDFTYLASLAVGGNGVISVLTNVFPKAFVKMHRLSLEGKRSAALDIHNAIFDFTSKLFIESNPCPTKYILAKLGLCENDLRLPLAPVTNESAKVIEESYEKAALALNKLEAL